MRTLIVGGGIAGLCTAWGLARLGHEVALFERGPLPQPLGSSFDQHRLIRHPYGDHEGYARMIDRAFEVWDLLWKDLGSRHHARTGTLALTGNGADWAEVSACTLGRIGRPMTEIPVGELSRRFPLLDPAGLERAFWLETGGLLFAQDIVADLVRHLATRPGVTLHPGTEVREVDPDRARLTTSDGKVHTGDRLVVAAGAWVGRLLPAIGTRVVPSRQVVAYFEPPPEARAAWATAPIVIEKTGDVGLYLAPPAEGRGLKVGDHEFSLRGDPDARRDDATPAEIAPLLKRCRSLLRGFDRWPAPRLQVCFYSVTRDERFIVEPVGRAGWAMSPCSGHGFKFGSVMGYELAATLVHERDPAIHSRWAAGLAGAAPF
ncbi:MAG: FAD-dependent oxidoreductase [Alphaproteobacteria bacterium]|nr:FAD-dependent oxidoreductase [Alphaproteobacteria bacterium]